VLDLLSSKVFGKLRGCLAKLIHERLGSKTVFFKRSYKKRERYFSLGRNARKTLWLERDREGERVSEREREREFVCV